MDKGQRENRILREAAEVDRRAGERQCPRHLWEGNQSPREPGNGVKQRVSGWRGDEVAQTRSHNAFITHCFARIVLTFRVRMSHKMQQFIPFVSFHDPFIGSLYGVS
jgi:hypothetical protein